MTNMDRFRFKAEKAAIIFISVLTAIYVIALLPQAPSLLGGIFSGDKEAGRLFLMGITVGAIGWGQWHYRDAVYPMHRKLKASSSVLL